MTRPDYCPIGEEPCQSLCDTPCSTAAERRIVDDAFRAGRAAEREACAKLCDELFTGIHSPYEYSGNCADLIRARALLGEPG